MAYKMSPQKTNHLLQERLDEHDQDIIEQRNITKFFVIVVAATLVATLVGLGGLYISAFSNRADYKNEGRLEGDINELRNKVDAMEKEMFEKDMQIQIIKAKNPYLKY